MLKTTFVLMAAAACSASAQADMVGMPVDLSSFNNLVATADGVIHDNEYGSIPFQGFGNGAGGLLQVSDFSNAARKVLFNMRPENNTFSVGLRVGASLGNKTVILLMDTKPGGRTAASGPGIVPISDSTDAARRALSRLDGTYPTGINIATSQPFGVDYAITFNSAGVGLFAFPDNTGSTFAQVGSYGGVLNATTGIAEAQWAGNLLTEGDFLGAFGFVALVADDSGLFNESMPQQPFNSGSAVAPSGTAIPNFNGMAVFIPAPTSAALLLALSGGLLRRRRS